LRLLISVLLLSAGRPQAFVQGARTEQAAGCMKKSLRVLIVEDSEFDAKIMVTLLRKSGYEVVFERVENAEALREALKSQPWQLILADYNLPLFNLSCE